MLTGHGSPVKDCVDHRCTLVSRSARKLQCALASFAWLFLFAWFPFCTSAQDTLLTSGGESASTRFETRILWGSNRSRVFEGTITLSSGTLELVRNLSLQPDSIDKFIASKRSVSVLPHSQSTFGGVDLVLDTKEDATLRIEFQDSSGSKSTVHSINIGELLAGPKVLELDQNARISVDRQASDRFRISSQGLESVSRVAEARTIQLEGFRTRLPQGEYIFGVHVVTLANSEQELVFEEPVQVDEFGSFAPIPFRLQIPKEEGAYAIEVSVRENRILGSILSQSTVVRRLEFIAFDPDGETTKIDGWEELFRSDAVKASKPGFLAWMNPYLSNPVTNAIVDPVTTVSGLSQDNNPVSGLRQWNPLNSSMSEPDSGGSLGTREFGPDSRECLALSPDAWLDIPLGQLDSGVPHRLIVSTPTDMPNELLFSIFTGISTDPPSTGSSEGCDYRIVRTRRDVLSDSAVNSNSQVEEHEFLFWPRAGRSFVRIANSSTSQDSSLVDFRVERAQLVRSVSNKDPAQTPSSIRSNERRVGIVVDKPLLAACLGTERAGDPSGRSFESWLSWQVACERLTTYLRWCKANLLVFKVQADGGAIFPSQSLWPTCRYDRGTFFSDSRSPEIKDAVQLLLDHCDRSGIQLVISLDLDAPFPNLRVPSGDASELRQISIDGKSFTTKYDPLNAEIQGKILEIFDEVVGRYGSHPAFGGVQLQLDAACQLTYRGDKWGYSNTALAAFAREQGIELSTEGMRERLNGSTDKAFIAWRARKLSDLYRQVAKRIHKGGNAPRLYLSPLRMWDEAPNSEDFIRPKEIARSPIEYLRTAGIDVASLQKIPGVTLIHGDVEQSRNTLDSEAWIRAVSRLKVMESGKSQSVFTILQPDELAKQFVEPKTDTTPWSSVYPINAGRSFSVRRNIVAQLAKGDPELVAIGAWLPLCTETSQIRSLFGTYREIPNVPFRELTPKSKSRKPQSSDCTVLKQATTEDKTYLQIINRSPWPIDCALIVRTAQSAAANIMGETQTQLIQQTVNADQQTWQLSIEPFGMNVVESSDPKLEVLDVVSAPPDAVVAQMQAEIGRLDRVIAQSSDPTRQSLLAEVFGGFEHWTAGNDRKPVKWNLSSLPSVQFQRATDFPHTGNYCLRITNTKDELSAWAHSEEFQVPTNGRLTLRAWLRVPTAQRNSVVRISVIGRTAAGERFERSKVFGSRNVPSQQLASDWGVRPATLDVADIPTDTLQNIFVAIQLVGKGTVWVDDVEVQSSWLHPDERVYLQGRLIVAKQGLENNNPLPAEELLDSSWGRYLSEWHPMMVQISTQVAENLVSPKNVEQILSPTEPAEESSSRTNWKNSPNLFQQLRRSMTERWRR